MGYSSTGKHYKMVNGKMITEAISQVTDNSIFKTKGKIILPPMSASIICVKMPLLCNTNNMYELNFSTFQLPEEVIPLDIIHRVDHKMPQYLNILMLNTTYSSYSIPRSSSVATLTMAERCEEIQEVGWDQV